jgi:hypothetical protein
MNKSEEDLVIFNYTSNLSDAIIKCFENDIYLYFFLIALNRQDLETQLNRIETELDLNINKLAVGCFFKRK